MSIRKILLFILLSGFGFSIGAKAQSPTGRIVGTVSDPSGAVVPNAKVTVTERVTGFSISANTNPEGIYVIPSVPPTQYTVTVEASGFRKYVQSGVTLLANQALTVNVRLEVGQATQTVTVSAQGEMVNTQTGTLGQVIGERRMVDLPLNGRNAMQLTTLVAGSIGAGQIGVQHFSTFPAAVTISTNGSRTDQVSYNLDGGNQTDSFTNVNLPFPFPDALQEFSVQTANYGAESGQNSGAVVNVVTKSGTNQLHGDLFEFVRNEVFNARNAFASKRDNLKRNQFGFTVGGPVVLPHIYNGRDRTFFFGGYQGTRFNTVTQTRTEIVPTNANLNGDFSALLNAKDPNNPTGRVIQIVDPQTGLPFPGNMIPASRFDPASAALMKYLPRSGGNGRIQFPIPSSQGFDEFTVKVDQSIGSRDHIFFRYFFDRFSSPKYIGPNNILAYNDGNLNKVQTAVLDFSHTFTPSLLNDFRFSVGSRFDQSQDSIPFSPKSLGVNVSLPPSPYDKAIRFYAPGFFYSITGPNSVFPTKDFTWADDLHWVHGRNNFAFGGVLQRSSYDQVAGDDTGSYDFTGDVTNYGLASLYLGFLGDFDQGGPGVVNIRNSFPGLYVQDSFRATKQLMLTAGLRWEPGLVPNETHGRIVTFNPQAYYQGKTSQVFVNAPPGLFYRGDPGILPNAAKSDWNNFSPRLGFAWDPFGKGKTSVRGGAGAFYNQRIGTLAMAFAGRTPPFTPGFSCVEPDCGPFSDPYRGTGTTFPYPIPPPAKNVGFALPITLRVYAPGATLTTPVAYNWNLTIEQALSVDWLLRVSYVGSHGSHLDHTLEINPATYIPGSTLGVQARRPFQDFGSIGMNATEGNSSYNALQVSLEKRVGNGSSVLHSMTVMANYTYSRSIDTDAPGANISQVSGGGNTLPVTNPGRVSFDTGPSVFDITHRFVASYVWDLPGLKGSNAFVRNTLGNWELSGIFNAQTGVPLTLFAGQNVSQTALNQDRVNYLGGSQYASGSSGCGGYCSRYLNPAAFALPAIGTFGNIGKGTIRAPGSWNLDAAILKNFPINERYTAQLRGDFFNFFNHANLGGPDTSISDPGFGNIYGVSGPRIIQVALKFIF